MSNVIGLDIGGAHLKLAHTSNGTLTDVRQVLCPLWKGLEHLDRALSENSTQASQADLVAITMTGELSDLFESREQGVNAIVDRAQREFGSRTAYWMGTRGFGNHDEAKKHFIDVGSTNFLATAQVTARVAPDALLVDMGSTTTDIVPINNGHAAVKGLTDPDRLASGELVYTGLTRTAVMAVTNHASFKGKSQTMAREYLATMADVYRILGTLNADDDLHNTADGRGKSRNESIARLARMLCRESADATPDEWRQLAAHISEIQLDSIKEGCTKVLARLNGNAPNKLVTAGLGHHQLRPLAKTFNLEPTTFGELISAKKSLSKHATAHAPAVAMALLANDHIASL